MDGYGEFRLVYKIHTDTASIIPRIGTLKSQALELCITHACWELASII